MTSSLLRKGAWTTEEDKLLKNCIEKFGEGKWHLVPLKAGLNRCRKSCRLRWLNYLRPNLKRGDFSEDEVDLMLRLHKLLGNRWSIIAGRIPGRTANDIKNYWNTHLRSRPKQQKGQLKDGESPEHTMVKVIKPQPRKISKALNLNPHIKACDTYNMITSSSMDGTGNAFNFSPDLLSSPMLSFEKNNGYWDELFDNPEKQFEIDDDQLGWSFGGFSAEKDSLDVVELGDPIDNEFLLGLLG